MNLALIISFQQEIYGEIHQGKIHSLLLIVFVADFFSSNS